LVQGQIASLPESNAGDVRFVLHTTTADQGVPRKLLLTWYRAPSIPAVGESWQLLVRLKRRNGFANPGGFDYEAHLFADGIGATGYVKDDTRNLRVGVADGFAVDRVRAWIAERMRLAAPNSQMLGVLQGLAIGDTRQMTSEQWEVFAKTGTIHLMAISGLHITMLAALAAWAGGSVVRLPRAQARGWSVVEGQVLAGGIAALGYALLAGLSIPTQRTLVMLALYFLARLYRRDLPIGHALGLAITALLIVDPFAPLSVGAWLSFGAVAVIVISMAGRLVRENAVRTFTRVQLALSVGLVPVLLGAFGSLSLISPFANAIAVPLFTGIVVPCVLVGALAAAIHPAIGMLPLQLATWILEALWAVLEALAKLPLAMLHFPELSPLTFGVLLIGAALFVLPGWWPSRLLGALLCSVALMARVPGPPVGAFRISVLDVGQGLAVVVQTHSKVAVFDTGPAFQSGRDAADFAVLPYLHAKGIRRINALIVSHADLDHRGGLDTLLSELPVDAMYVGPSMNAVNAHICTRGERWIWDEVTFEFLHPARDFHDSDNETSCVLRVESKTGSALLTGDIEIRGENALIDAGLTPVQIVVVPHHGSRTSSSDAFVQASGAQLAVFSAGYRNRWGMPKVQVVQRWRDSGARVLSTSQSGAIEIDVGASLTVREHRKQGRRYWSRAPECLDGDHCSMVGADTAP
jgi:competence protein ComEC